MAGSLVSDYGIGDTNFDNMMLTLDKAYKGEMRISLTEYNSSNVPQIEAGSWGDSNGALFKFDTLETISTTDPVTSVTVTNGTVYIVLVPSGSSITAAFTSTSPDWSGSKQGYYNSSVGGGNYRYIARMVKDSTNYDYKAVMEGRDFMRKSYENINTVYNLAGTGANGLIFGTYSFVQNFSYDVEAVISTTPLLASNTTESTFYDYYVSIDSISISGSQVTTVIRWNIIASSSGTYVYDLSLSLNTSIVGI